ncbi:MAG: hypothetical protein ACI97A_001264 [Planctomycetota bacterium]|jgi:hypothetical protein
MRRNRLTGRYPKYWATVILCIFLGGCFSSQEVPFRSHDQKEATREHWHRTEMYFGMKKKDGSSVTSAAFEKFVDDVITPRFKDGLTVVKATGQWQNESAQVIEEESRVVILFHLDSVTATNHIKEIAGHYKTQYAQESVLVVTEDTNLRFH